MAGLKFIFGTASVRKPNCWALEPFGRGLYSILFSTILESLIKQDLMPPSTPSSQGEANMARTLDN